MPYAPIPVLGARAGLSDEGEYVLPSGATGSRRTPVLAELVGRRCCALFEGA